MTIPQNLKLKNTIKYPTSIIVGGLNRLGLEIADSLMKQGGYVIIVDNVSEENVQKLNIFPKDVLLSFVDYTAIPHLDDDIRRLDYVFYFAHETIDFKAEVSTQEFLTFSNYLDAILSLATKFESRFLLTTSLKANQILMNESVLGNTSANKYTPVYTDMEIQRYAEGLTIEYFEKVELNARITRLGEMVGEGMDFSNNSAFVKLLMNAVKGEPLMLENDGLENEWYINMLDAAYGIIKAQFTKGTEGKVFSLCYDNIYTHLSVAYRIQEIEEDVREIKFIEGSASTISVRTHKPAPNLASVGWMPRMPFDRAVAQSVSAAKIFILENGINSTEEIIIQKSSSKNSTAVDKLRSFLSLADSKEITVDNSSPVTKLVAKKRNEENTKKQKLTSVGTVIRLKRAERKKTRTEKLINGFWKSFVRLANTFTFMKRMSPAELAILTFFMITFAIIFFTLVSPILIISRNILNINSLTKDLQESISAQDSTAVNQNTKSILSSINEIDKSLDTLRPIFNVITLGDELSTVDTLTEAYSDILEGVADISYATQPISGYFSQLMNNTQLRNTTSTYLSTTNPGLNYSSILDDSESRLAFIESGMRKISRGLNTVQNQNITNLPEFVRTYFVNSNTEIRNISNISKNIEINEYVAELLGNNLANNIVILFLDNARPTPIGGDIAAFANLNVLNGSIQGVTILSSSQATFNLTSIDQSDLDLINSNRFISKSVADINFTDLSSIKNIGEFSSVAKEIWQDSFNITPDVFITINLNVADELTKEIVKNDNIEIKGVNFANGTLLNNITATLLGTESLSERRDSLAQLLSHLLNKGLNNLISNPASITNLLSKSLENGDVVIYAGQKKFQKYVRGNNLDLASVNNTDNYAQISFGMYDPKIVNSTRFSNISFDIDSFIRSDFSVQNTASITFPNLGTNQEASVCLPYSTVLGSVVADSNLIPSLRTALNTKSDRVCVVFQSIAETQARLTWVTRINENVESSSGEISYGVGLAKGSLNSADIQISSDQAVNINFTGTAFTQAQVSGVLSNSLTKDLVEVLRYRKE